MMKLKPKEMILVGSWKLFGGSVEADSVCERIEWLITEYLIEIGEDESGWNKLYQDPENNRYWELTYPESETHGGGAPQLKNISTQEAERKYKI
jgi:hypothetical protein